MSQILEWIDRLLQDFMWRSLAERFSWVDFMTCAFLVLGIIYGLKKGLFAEILETFMTALALNFSIQYFEAPAEGVNHHLTGFRAAHPDTIYSRMISPLDPGVVKFAVFLCVSVIFLLAFYWGVFKLRKVIHTTLIAWLRLLGGALLGALHFMILWSWLAFALILLPTDLAHSFHAESGSITGQFIKKLPSRIQKLLDYAIPG